MNDESKLIQVLTRPVFEKSMDFIRKTRAGVPRTFTIDLSIALTDQPYNMGGNVFYVLNSPDATSYIDVKFNTLDSSMVRLSHQVGLRTPYEKIYITTPAGQTGTMTILTGVEAPDYMEIIDNRGATSLDMAQIRAELQGDSTPENWGEITVGVAQTQLLAANVDRKGCWLHSDPNNTGIIYLGFDNTVTTAAGGNNWFAALSAGQGWGVDDYRGAIHAISTVAGQLVGTGEW